jgi:hypothetical protein
LDLLDGKWRLLSVNHDMAIGAYWSQILNWIDFILLANCGKGADMMDMNDAIGHRAVSLRET